MFGISVTTVRNLFGGFVGGAVGSLLFYLAHPDWMYLGCLFGALLGFWFDLIPKKIQAAWLVITHEAPELSSLIPKNPITFDFAQKLRQYCSKFQDTWIFWKVRIRWLRLHPLNQAETIRTFAVYTNGIIVGVCVIIFAILATLSGKSQVFLAIIFGDIMFIVCSYCAYLIFENRSSVHSRYEELLRQILGNPREHQFTRINCLSTETDSINHAMTRSEETSNFYLLWSDYSRLGGLGLFLKDFAYLLSLEIGFTLIGTVVLAGLTLSYAVLLAITIIVSLFVIGQQMLALLARKGEHWLCLGVTVMTTFAFTRFFESYFGNPQGLLLTLACLATGILCGGLSELARQLVIRFVAYRKKFKPTEIITRATNVWLGYAETFIQRTCETLFKPLETVGKI